MTPTTTTSSYFLTTTNNNKEGVGGTTTVDDELLSLMPNCHFEQIKKDIVPGLEIERKCDVSFFRLAFHNFFLDDGESAACNNAGRRRRQQQQEQQQPAVKAPKLESHTDWLGSSGGGTTTEWPITSTTSTSITGSIVKKKQQQQQQQSAHQHHHKKDDINDDEIMLMMIPYCVSFCKFLWRRNTTGCWKKVRLLWIVGTIPAIISILMGLFIDELNNDTSIGQTTWHQYTNVIILAIVMFVLFVVSLFANYEYEKTIPLGALKFHLRQVVMRKLMGMADESDGREPPHPIAKTSGASVALLGIVIHDSINIVWDAMFNFILMNITGISTMIGAILATAHSFLNSKRYWIVLYFIIFVIIQYAWVIVLFYKRRKPIVQLSIPVYSWQLRYYSLGQEQLQSMYHHHQNQNYDNNHARTTTTDMEQQQQQTASTAAAATANTDYYTWKEEELQSYGDAAFIYRKRSFHLYFVQLVTKDLVLMVGKFLYTAFVLLFAVEVIGGHMTVGTLVALIGCATLHMGMAEKVIGTLTSLPQGYMAIRQLADVINYKDPSKGEQSKNNTQLEANHHGTPPVQEKAEDEETALPSSSPPETGLKWKTLTSGSLLDSVEVMQ